MDSNIDSTHSCNISGRTDEMSYLFGRDPSILAYSQRPHPSDHTKKNLLSVYESEELDSIESNTANSSSIGLQTVKVYLRMKPLPKKLKLSQDQLDAYKITDSTTLETRLPALENNSSFIRTKCTDIACRTYTFTQTFGPEITQLELFQQAIKQQMVDFLAGQSCTVMTYGTTNSGKSYTLQGTITSPGIIPRALEFVFSNITPKSVPSYKPIHHCDVTFLNSAERSQELHAKAKLLSFGSVDKNQYINTYKQMQKILHEESPIRSSSGSDAYYSVWVSFAEIYNETIYDLLSTECQKKKVPLKLATDVRGRAFIKGLRTVYVNSGAEAYQVLMAGQYNLKVAATALNSRSSRSHCIFTIKLLKYYTENISDTVDVSTFSFCDLAGSERLKKTLNIGDRLKEAQNINTSLLVLGKCLKSIHEGQLAKQKSDLIVGPFRESKLTRLFQKALSGKEQIALIVNVNPLPNLYIETQNVLNFSAIAKRIIIQPKPKKQKVKSRFSQIVTKSMKTVTDWDTEDLESTDWPNADTEADTADFVHSEEYEELWKQNKKLKKEILNLKNSALARDLQIRQEITETYTNIIRDLENEWKAHIKDVEEQQEDNLQWSVKQVEDFYKQKIAQLDSRKRRRSLESNEDENDNDNAQQIDELESENAHLISKIANMKDIIKELREKSQTLTVEKNKVEFELSLKNEELKNMKKLLHAAQKDNYDEEEAHYIEELKSQLLCKDEHIKKLKEFLNEAKEEYIQITSDVQEKENIITEREKLLVEYEEKIDELEGQIEHTSYLLIKKRKTIETLETTIEQQTTEIANLKEKIKLLSDKESNAAKPEKKDDLKEESVVNYVEVGTNTSDIVAGNNTCKCNLTIELKETECQVDILNDVLDKIKIDEEVQVTLSSTENKCSQTSTPLTKEETNQTSFTETLSKEECTQTEVTIDESFTKTRQQLQELNEKYNDIKVMHENVLLKLEETRAKLDESEHMKREKDDEITAIQKELKMVLQLKDLDEKSVSVMETELKDALKNLTDTKEMLSYKEQKISDLEARLQSMEHSIKFVNILQKEKERQQEEMEELRLMANELKRNLDTKEQERENFMKNRDETVMKYESLVKSLQEEVDRQKREVMRYQELFCRKMTTPNKDECKRLQSKIDSLEEKVKYYESMKQEKEPDNVSEDGVMSCERRLRPRGRKDLSPQPEIIDLSGSESKRSARRQPVAPPSSDSTVEKKKGSRKKKLFVADDSVQDIEPLEESTPSNSSKLSIQPRSLRSRKK